MHEDEALFDWLAPYIKKHLSEVLERAVREGVVEWEDRDNA